MLVVVIFNSAGDGETKHKGNIGLKFLCFTFVVVIGIPVGGEGGTKKGLLILIWSDSHSLGGSGFYTTSKKI